MNPILKAIKKHKILFNRSNAVKEWITNGKVYPPPHELKQSVIEFYRNHYSLDVFIETGTYLGKMVKAQIPFFKYIYSIELSKELYEKSKVNFANHSNVFLLQGDSGNKLNEIVLLLKNSALFWLDGHYSEGFTAKGNLHTPIVNELKAVLVNSKFNHVILVDDARCFNGENDYPAIEELKKLVQSLNPNYFIVIEDDIIRITPSEINVK